MSKLLSMTHHFVSLRLKKAAFLVRVLICVVGFQGISWSAKGAGTEGASFLDIPVGSVPASLGSAYSARATDAYAPVWNPAGLAFADAVRLSATHVEYLAGIHYDYIGFAIPVNQRRGFGASVQYLGSGKLIQADEAGNITGSFSAAFAAYSLAYAQKLNSQLSLGVTGKVITESIADASAKSYAGDLGLLYKVNDKVSLATVAANLGPNLKLVRTGDPLPMALRLGAFAQLFSDVDLSGETVYRRTGQFSVKAGVQGKYAKVLIFRLGLDTAHVRGLSGLSLITGGLGIHAFGQEFAYAWVPYSDLGHTHYFSLDFRFGRTPEAPVTGIIQSDVDSDSETRPASRKEAALPSSDYDLLDQLLSDNEKKGMQPRKSPQSQKDPE